MRKTRRTTTWTSCLLIKVAQTQDYFDKIKPRLPYASSIEYNPPPACQTEHTKFQPVCELLPPEYIKLIGSYFCNTETLNEIADLGGEFNTFKNMIDSSAAEYLSDQDPLAIDVQKMKNKLINSHQANLDQEIQAQEIQPEMIDFFEKEYRYNRSIDLDALVFNFQAEGEASRIENQPKEALHFLLTRAEQQKNYVAKLEQELRNTTFLYFLSFGVGLA